MDLYIHYPFRDLPNVVFEIIIKVQNIHGTVKILSSDFVDDKKQLIAERWVYRMLSSHRSDEQAMKIFEKLLWEVG